MSELEELDKSNERRQMALQTGEFGVPVMIPPGTFELQRILLYLEALLGESSEELKLRSAQQTATVLDKFEQSVREAIIKQGGAPGTRAVDLAAVHSINRQMEKSKA